MQILIMKQPSIHKILYFSTVTALAAFIITMGLAVHDDTAKRNLYVYQAEGFLRGELDIPVELGDVSVFNDKYYVPFPPAPAIVLLPFVAIFGEVKPSLIALLLTILNVLIFLKLMRHLDVEHHSILLLTLGFFLGTGYWLVVKGSSGETYFAHVVATTFMLLAIDQSLISGRGIFAGLFVGCAFLSRQLTIFSIIFVVPAILLNTNNSSARSKITHVIGFGITLCLCISFYLILNKARFGSVFDTGYSYLQLEGDVPLGYRFSRFGLFHPAYFPFNFTYMFVQGPHIEFVHWLVPVGMDPFGTSLVFASPFVFLAFLSRSNKTLIYSAWAAAGLILLTSLFYYNNGWWQSNTQRFTLDFLPILLVPLALSMQRVNKHLLFVLVIYSVALNFLALLILPGISWIVAFLD